jgi:adenine-specific DNA-methyltransferase
MSLVIGNRRYTGSKKALLEDIYRSIKPHCKEGEVFADLFAGTGIVSEYMLRKGMNVVMNDNLRSNYIAYQAWFGRGRFSFSKLEKLIEEFNLIDSKTLINNYFSKIYGGKYFSIPDAKKIGYIRDLIDKKKLTVRERDILLASLMYATDKIANTVGHFEHYLSKVPVEMGVTLKMPQIDNFKGRAEIYNVDANALTRKITCCVAYIDPPYNARQYVNFYHVLENLIRWEKPTEFEGSSMKFKRNHLKSDYSKAKAPEVFRDLINNLQAKIIVVSYNNTYSAKSSASNNKISESELLGILSSRGKVTVKEIKHKSFNSGKTNFLDHKEILYICNTKL